MTTWMQQSLCAEIGGDFWFPEPGEDNYSAKKICDACPVRQECLQYALDEGLVEFGMWGGTSARQRSQMPHARTPRSLFCSDGHLREFHEKTDYRGARFCDVCRNREERVA